MNGDALVLVDEVEGEGLRPCEVNVFGPELGVGLGAEGEDGGGGDVSHGGDEFVVGVEDGEALRGKVLKDGLFFVGDGLAGAEGFVMVASDGEDDADVGQGGAGEEVDTSGFAGAEFEDDEAVAEGDGFEKGGGDGVEAVEGAGGFGSGVAGGEDVMGEVFGGGFAAASGNGDDGGGAKEAGVDAEEAKEDVSPGLLDAGAEGREGDHGWGWVWRSQASTEIQAQRRMWRGTLWKVSWVARWWRADWRA